LDGEVNAAVNLPKPAILFSRACFYCKNCVWYFAFAEAYCILEMLFVNGLCGCGAIDKEIYNWTPFLKLQIDELMWKRSRHIVIYSLLITGGLPAENFLQSNKKTLQFLSEISEHCANDKANPCVR